MPKTLSFIIFTKINKIKKIIISFSLSDNGEKIYTPVFQVNCKKTETLQASGLRGIEEKFGKDFLETTARKWFINPYSKTSLRINNKSSSEVARMITFNAKEHIFYIEINDPSFLNEIKSKMNSKKIPIEFISLKKLSNLGKNFAPKLLVDAICKLFSVRFSGKKFFNFKPHF